MKLTDQQIAEISKNVSAKLCDMIDKPSDDLADQGVYAIQKEVIDIIQEAISLTLEQLRDYDYESRET